MGLIEHAKIGGSRTKSTSIWNVFKKDNPQLSQEMTIGRFKEILIAVVGDIHVDMPKGKAGAIEILGMRIDSAKVNNQDVIHIVT